MSRTLDDRAMRELTLDTAVMLRRHPDLSLEELAAMLARAWGEATVADLAEVLVELHRRGYVTNEDRSGTTRYRLAAT